MLLPTELYEKAAAGHYTLDEVRSMEQVAELEDLDPSQLLRRLAQMATEKAAEAPSVVVPGKPAGAGMPKRYHQDLASMTDADITEEGHAALSHGGIGRADIPGSRYDRRRAAPSKKKEAMNPNFSLTSFEAQQAAGGTALKDLLTKYRAAKTGSTIPEWLRTPAGRAAGGVALGGLAGAIGGVSTGYMAGGDRKQVGRATRRGATVGAIAGGLRAIDPAAFPMGKAASEPWDAARVKDVALHAAIHGGVGLGLGGAGVLAHRALSGIADKVTSGRDRRRILEVHPSIARENTPEQIDLAFNSLRRFSPHVTKDPLAGGNALGTILRSRDPLDPSSAPRISGATVAADLGSKVLPPKSEAESAITSAMMAGAQGAMGAAHQRTMETAVKQPHAERMELRRDVLQRDRDADIQASRRNAAQVNILRDYLVNQLGYHPDSVESILTGPKP